MAKKKSGTNRSQSIRDYLQTNPEATATQIVKALAKKGIKVTVSLASNVKYTSGPGAKKKKAKKKRAVGRKRKTVSRKRPRSQGVDMATLQAAAKFVAVVGDVETAIAAVKQVQTLQIG